MNPIRTIFIALLLGLISDHRLLATPLSEIVSFTSGKHSFSGYIFKPKGDGPFPALVWNHGHRNHLLPAGPVSEYDALARLYTDAGYVLFLPDRHLSDIAHEEYSLELQALLKKGKPSNSVRQRQYIEYMEINADDIMAALAWLKKQSYVDARRIAMSGWNTGATASLLTAKRAAGIRAYVPFSIGVTRWQENEPMQLRLQQAIQTSSAPIFLIHASNDPTLVPSEILGSELAKKGEANQMQVYSFSGTSDTQITSLAIVSTGIWGRDVLKFLNTAMPD